MVSSCCLTPWLRRGVVMQGNATLEILLHPLLQISAPLFCLGPALRGSSCGTSK